MEPMIKARSWTNWLFPSGISFNFLTLWGHSSVQEWCDPKTPWGSTHCSPMNKKLTWHDNISVNSHLLCFTTYNDPFITSWDTQNRIMTAKTYNIYPGPQPTFLWMFVPKQPFPRGETTSANICYIIPPMTIKNHQNTSGDLSFWCPHHRRHPWWAPVPVESRSASCLEVVDWPSRTRMPCKHRGVVVM